MSALETFDSPGHRLVQFNHVPTLNHVQDDVLDVARPRLGVDEVDAPAGISPDARDEPCGWPRQIVGEMVSYKGKFHGFFLRFQVQFLSDQRDDNIFLEYLSTSVIMENR